MKSRPRLNMPVNLIRRGSHRPTKRPTKRPARGLGIFNLALGKRVHCKQPPLPDPACCTCGTLYRNFHFFCNADPPELCCTLPTATYCAALGAKVHDFPGSKLLLVAFRAVFSRDPLFLFLKYCYERPRNLVYNLLE